MLWPRLGRNAVSRPRSAPVPAADPALVEALRARLEAAGHRRLGRSIALRHVDAGSCNGCELELNATGNVVHDLQRLGLRFVASPRHADALVVTGPMTRNMRAALERCRAAAPAPVWVVAIGDCAADGGVFRGSYAVENGVAEAVPVDLLIPGCPPAPEQILQGLLALVEANGRNPLGRGGQA